MRRQEDSGPRDRAPQSAVEAGMPPRQDEEKMAAFMATKEMGRKLPMAAKAGAHPAHDDKGMATHVVTQEAGNIEAGLPP